MNNHKGALPFRPQKPPIEQQRQELARDLALLIRRKLRREQSPSHPQTTAYPPTPTSRARKPR